MDKELQNIKSKSFLSVASLLAQSSYSAALGFIAFFILTLKSGVYLLGIYNTVLAAMSFFNYFTNLGLAAAIVQKKSVDDTDLSTAFYIQMALATAAVIIGFFLTNPLLSLYKDLPVGANFLYWAMLISFFFLSLKTVPSVLLEKKIEIYKVVFVQVVENTLFYGTIILFSSIGFEMESLIIAVLLRSIVGMVFIYILNPWFPKLLFSWHSAKLLLKYGIPFQGNSFLALLKDDLLIIYLGSRIGLTNLGYVSFGKKYAEFSIRLITDNINRVAFPLFSKFQHDAGMLKKSLEKVLFFESFLIFPIIIGAVFVFDVLLKIVPQYFDKWHLALFSFYFFSLSSILVSLSTPFINLFNAVGKVKTSLAFMVLWTTLTWVLIPVSINLFDYNGISIAFFIMSTTFIFVVLTAKKYIEFSFRNFFNRAFLPSMVMSVFLITARIFFLKDQSSYWLFLVMSVVGGSAIYFGSIYLLYGKGVFLEIIDLMRLQKSGK